MPGIETLTVRAGITVRQADHWTRKGYLKPDNAECGSGRSRQWSYREIEVARVMKVLTDAGVTPAAAQRAARDDGWLRRDGAAVRVDMTPAREGVDTRA